MTARNDLIRRFPSLDGSDLLDAIEAEARRTTPLGVHKPGDHHEYDLTCKVCGQPGLIRVSIDPERVTPDSTGARDE